MRKIKEEAKPFIADGILSAGHGNRRNLWFTNKKRLSILSNLHS